MSEMAFKFIPEFRVTDQKIPWNEAHEWNLLICQEKKNPENKKSYLGNFKFCLLTMNQISPFSYHFIIKSTLIKQMGIS